MKSQRAYRADWDISFGTILIREYVKDIVFAIFREIGPASLLLWRKKLHVTLDG